MGKVWSKIDFVMPTESDYEIMEHMLKGVFDGEDVKYLKKVKRIKIEAYLATQDDIVELVKEIEEVLREEETPERKSICRGLKFRVEGTTEFSNNGAQIDYIIERNYREITIQETDTYCYIAAYDVGDYDEFCSLARNYMYSDPRKFLSEEEYDSEFGEYYVTCAGIYNGIIEYGSKYLISEYKYAGEVYSVD